MLPGTGFKFQDLHKGKAYKMWRTGKYCRFQKKDYSETLNGTYVCQNYTTETTPQTTWILCVKNTSTKDRNIFCCDQPPSDIMIFYVLCSPVLLILPSISLLFNVLTFFKFDMGTILWLLLVHIVNIFFERNICFKKAI